MKATDIIRVNVTGTNGTTRKQSTISRVFDGDGNKLTDQGKIDLASQEVLRNLPTGEASELPKFPDAAFQAAFAEKNTQKIKEIQLAYAGQVAEWENQQGGGSENLRVAKSVLEYAKEFHGFREEDGDHFVMKLENLDVTTMELPDGRNMYTVTGTAVFGG